MLDSPTLHVHLLGRFYVVVGYHAIPQAAWRLRTAAALVKLLALAPDYRLHREQLMDALWPDAGTDAAAGNLRYSLHTARRVLQQSGQGALFFKRDGETLALGPPELVSVDAVAFERAVADAWTGADPSIMLHAINLYVGDLLPDDPYEDWAALPRAALRDKYLALLARLVDVYEQRGEVQLAIDMSQRLIQAEPTLEHAHVRLMRLYALAGQPHLALTQYARLRGVLERELGTEPETATQELVAAIQDGRLSAKVTSPSAATHAEPDRAEASISYEGVPAPLNALIGREHEVAAVCRLLQTSRLVTLTGVGGIGKTRLAVAVAAAFAGRLRDGAVVVSLAAVQDPELLVSAIGQAINVGDHGDASLVDLVTSYLRDKQMLMVLDNFEHLLEFGPLLARMLERCRGLTLLVTSRSRLQLSGEQEYPVPPLQHPDPTTPALPATIAEYPAVELFVRRAREVRPSFEITTDNAAAVAETCRRLDGVPLAIELAAARSKILSPQEIVLRIDAPLSLLTGGPRDAPERQRTMRNTIMWSYELLDPDEQRLFHRLSVFAGGCTLAAADAVAGPDGASIAPTFELLASLVDKNLVNQQASSTGESRISLYEPIREFGIECLDALDELDLVRERHADYFALLAEPTVARLEGPDPGSWLDRLEMELDNFRAALQWSIGSRRADLALRLAGSLWEFWSIRGHLSEGRRWLDAALELAGGTDSVARAEALRGAGELAVRQGDFNEARRLDEQALASFRRFGHDLGIARTLNSLGLLSMGRDDVAEARAYFEECMRVSERVGDANFAGRLRHNLAGNMILEGDYDEARRLLEINLLQYRGSSNRRVLAHALCNLGIIAHDQGDYEQSRIWKEESLELFRKQGDRLRQAILIYGLGQWAFAVGDHELAQRRFEESIILSRELGNRPEIATGLRLTGELALARGEPSRAARLFGAAEALRETVHWNKSSPSARASYQQAVDRLHASLDETTLADAWSDGRRMPLDQAVEYAVSGGAADATDHANLCSAAGLRA
jgi:predicted ATPase/DNA-binding SARP family transcriptional activator